MKLTSYVSKDRRRPAAMPAGPKRTVTRQEQKQSICPFTLEPSVNCTTKRASFRVRCSYTLEACFR